MNFERNASGAFRSKIIFPEKEVIYTMVTVQVENDNIELALRKFKKAIEKECVLDEYKKRRYFVKPSTIRHQKKVAAKRQLHKK